jgi:hypothetical protein
MIVGMKFGLRNILLAVPCFAMAIGVCVQNERSRAATIEANEKGGGTLEGMREVSRKWNVPSRRPNNRFALVMVFLGVVLLFGRWRIATVIVSLIVIGTVLDFAK